MKMRGSCFRTFQDCQSASCIHRLTGSGRAKRVGRGHSTSRRKTPQLWHLSEHQSTYIRIRNDTSEDSFSVRIAYPATFSIETYPLVQQLMQTRFGRCSGLHSYRIVD
jgi:hypothetical protein